MIGLTIAGAATVAWGNVRYARIPSWETLCSDGAWVGPPAEPVNEAVILPWVLLLLLATVGLLIYALRLRRWPTSRRRPFEAIGVIGWILVVLLSPIGAHFWAIVESAGICWS